jgi:selenocysteine lyase/cysteine desulfurase
MKNNNMIIKEIDLKEIEKFIIIMEKITDDKINSKELLFLLSVINKYANKLMIRFIKDVGFKNMTDYKNQLKRNLYKDMNANLYIICHGLKVAYILHRRDIQELEY